MEKINFFDVSVTCGFWKQKIDLIKNTTVMAIYDRFSETHRFDALDCEWRKKGNYESHIFWDLDVAKWIEAASFYPHTDKNEKIENIIDNLISKIIPNSDDNGYFNSFFLNDEEDKRFAGRGNHELYCARHFIEAAIAYKRATGSDTFLKAMCHYADYIEKVFKIEKTAAFKTPGHPEIELALVKLYNETGEKRYLELSKYFIDERGGREEDFGRVHPAYNQSDMPIRGKTTIDGHCVRALYLLCGCADIAEKHNDKELLEVCKKLFNNLTENRMYITGGVGNAEIDSKDIQLNVETNYPSDGIIKVSFNGNKKYIALRIPAWCKNYSINREYVFKNGYAYIKVEENTKILLNLEMPVQLIKANRNVRENAGRVAVMCGPIVYCLEEIDNGNLLRDISIDVDSKFVISDNEFMLPSLKTVAFRFKRSNLLYENATNDDYVSFEARFIPYYAFANRNESDMIVWVLRK